MLLHYHPHCPRLCVFFFLGFCTDCMDVYTTTCVSCHVRFFDGILTERDLKSNKMELVRFQWFYSGFVLFFFFRKSWLHFLFVCLFAVCFCHCTKVSRFYFVWFNSHVFLVSTVRFRYSFPCSFIHILVFFTSCLANIA